MLKKYAGILFEGQHHSIDQDFLGLEIKDLYIYMTRAR